MKSLICGAIVALTGAGGALAQTSPGLQFGEIPTSAQWNGYFASKQDYLGSPPLLITGGAMQGTLTTVPSTTTAPGLVVPPGTAPTSPINGALWSTSSGVFAQVNGVTYNMIAPGGAVVGPATTTVGDIATWNNTTGTLMGALSAVPIAKGGTGQTTQQTALNALAPTPTRAGDIIYYNGTNWIHLAGNNAGTKFIQESASGIPSWEQVPANSTVLYIDSFGGDPTGVSDSSFALASACVAANALPTGGAIVFSQGKYLFNSAVTCNYPIVHFFSMTFVGAGAGATILLWPTTDALSVNALLSDQSVHFRDLKVITGTTGKNGISLNQAQFELNVEQSDFYRFSIGGSDTGVGDVNYWSCAVCVTNWSDINFDSTTFWGGFSAGVPQGIGIKLSSSGSGVPQLAYFYNISQSGIFDTSIGISIGSQIQGVTVDRSQFVNSDTCIQSTSGGTNESLLVVSDSQFNCFGDQIQTNSPIASVMAQGNIFYIQNNFSGVHFLASSSQNTISSNVFVCAPGVTCATANGINMDAAVTDSVISNNVFSSIHFGYILGTSTSNIVGSQNVFDASVTTPFVNNGTGNKIGIATP